MAHSTNTQFAVAVHVLTYLAKFPDGRPVSSDELSMSANVSPVYVRRVLGPLRAAGVLESRPGARGGWALAREPQTITLAAVWRLLQGDDHVLGLHGPDPACPVGRHVQASLVQLDAAVADAIEARLARLTVRDMLPDAAAQGAHAVP